MSDARRLEVDLFSLLSRDLENIFGQIVSIRVNTLSDTDLVASTHVKREKGSLPIDVCRLPLLFTADGMLCFYSLSSLLIWIFRGVSYVTWENQDKVFEKTEVGELKQNGRDGHGYSL